MRFDWDDSKAASNRRKHGVSFEEAATVFADPFAVRVHDELHSTDVETRWIVLGLSARTRVLFVVFCEVGRTTIRIISARGATMRERRDYEENRHRYGG